MKGVIGLALLACCLGHVAVAGQIAITGEDIVWPADQSTSPQHFFKVKSDSDSVIMTSWQLTMAIIPSANTTGSVWFKSVSAPPGCIIPHPSDTISIVPSTTVGPIVGIDWAGVAVPSSWVDILRVGFETSADASGRFDIAIIPMGDMGASSLWSSADFVEVAFANVPFDGGPEVVGSLLVGSSNAATPEPTTGLLAASASLLLIAIRFIHRHRRV